MILKGSLGGKAKSHVAEAGLRLLRSLKTTVTQAPFPKCWVHTYVQSQLVGLFETKLHLKQQPGCGVPSGG